MIMFRCLTLARICADKLPYSHIQKYRYPFLMKNVRTKETGHTPKLGFHRLNNSFKPMTGLIVPLKGHNQPCLVADFHSLARNGVVVLQPHEIDLQQQRQKSKKKTNYSRHGQQEEDPDDSDEDERFELEEGEDFQEVKVRLPSLRLDAVMKAGFNMSRSKAEAAFYGNKVKVNGKKASKKSKQLHEGDEVDLIRDSDTENTDVLKVSRVAIMVVGDYSADTDKISVKLRKYPNLIIDKENERSF